jgi:hypothetical protein
MRKFAVIVPALMVTGGICCSPHDAIADSYAFSGLDISNFVVFKEDSVADAMDLTQGPNRNGAGSRIRSTELDRGNYGLIQGSGYEISLDGESWQGAGGPSCIGDCSAVEMNFERPIVSPADPSIGAHFSRYNVQKVADVFLDSNNQPYRNSMIAEMEFVRTPRRNSKSRFQRRATFVVTPEFTDEWVIDFDADLALRTIADEAISKTYITSQSIFSIELMGPSGTHLFEFTPNGSGLGHFGAIVAADPFSLNETLLANVPPPREDEQHIGVGQFRAITPVVNAGVTYRLRIGQEVVVTAVVVPEPSTFALFAIGCAAIGSRRRAGR